MKTAECTVTTDYLTLRGTEIRAKRIELPGVDIESVCPHCSAVVRVSLSNSTLSYPRIGRVFHLYMEHYVGPGENNHTWKVFLSLDVTITSHAVPVDQKEG